MGRQIRPAKVYQRATAEINSRIMPRYQVQQPPWYSVVYNNPPAETITRPAATQLRSHQPNQKRPKNVYRPQRISFPEDKLRQEFYKEHPWELARPRMILELDGKDSRMLDWSTGVRQPGIPLSGECVVQRQMWLIDNGMPKANAYDTARKEFYALRHQEEVEKRVAKEEAQFVGAYFGKTRLEIGHQLEGQSFEHWKSWAAVESEKMKSLRGEKAAAQAEDALDSLEPSHDLTVDL